MLCKHPAGVACRCNLKGDCLVRYQITSDAGLFEFKNGDNKFSTIKLVDKGQGTKVNIAIEGKCTNNLTTCPTGYLSDERSFSEALSTSQCKDHTLFYRQKSGQDVDLFSAIQYLLAQDGFTGIPYTRYKVCITQCAGKPQTQQTLWLSPPHQYLLGQIPYDTYIEVYPKVDIESKLTLDYSGSKSKLSDEDRYTQYIERQKKGMLDGTPIPTQEIKKKFNLSGTLTVSQGSSKTEYSASKTMTKSNLVKVKNIQDSFENFREQWSLINGIIGIVEHLKNGTYQNTGADKVKLVSFDFGPPKLVLEGKRSSEIVDSKVVTTGNVTLKFDPLCDLKISLDLILAAAAYFKMEKAVAEIRKQAKQLEEKVKAGEIGAYAGAEFFISLTTKLDASGTVTFNSEHPAKYDLSQVATVTLSSLVNLRGGAKVWVVEGAFLLEAKVVAEGKIALRSKIKDKKPLVELIFFHDGIKAEVKIEISGDIAKEGTESTKGNSGFWGGWGSSENSVEVSAKNTYTKEWIWAKALSETNSRYRTTLIGG
ncbi:hypothetical protein CR151_08570 [Vibrio cholerae]|uniref:hypothetical protein n=1 Tax=Vibrio cholerae TaxID=666 RepID=UPI000C7E930A|nr:hypothetical protein [Vibrio cholerae]PKQ53631.1 hypothetical protein CR151_08570 [Vibrio cholerae]